MLNACASKLEDRATAEDPTRGDPIVTDASVSVTPLVNEKT